MSAFNPRLPLARPTNLKPGDAQRLAAYAASAGITLCPWQVQLLEDLEAEDVAAAWAELTARLRPLRVWA